MTIMGIINICVALNLQKEHKHIIWADQDNNKYYASYTKEHPPYSSYSYMQIIWSQVHVALP